MKRNSSDPCPSKYSYKIVGKDRRYGRQECYGMFETLKDAAYHMDKLCRSLGSIVKFKIMEVNA